MKIFRNLDDHIEGIVIGGGLLVTLIQIIYLITDHFGWTK